VLVVAGPAAPDAVGRRRVRRAVADGARRARVAIVPESHAARRRRLGSHHDPDLHRSRPRERGGGVASRAILRLDPSGDQRLVMTEVAPPGRLEDEAGTGIVELVAGEAGERGVATVREGIRRAVSLAGQQFEDPRDWADSVAALLSAAGTGPQFTGAPVPAR